jgi:hypothetical protein
MRFAAADRPRLVPLRIAAVGLLLCAIALFLVPGAVFAGWLATTLFVLGFPLGAMSVLMIHGLTGGRWGVVMRAPLRAIVATLPLALALLLPLLFRPDLIFPWAAPDPAGLPDTVRLKLAYLNLPFFLLRFVVYAAAWLILAWLVLKGTDEKSRLDGKTSALGLVIHAFAIAVFSTDWMLSLEPDFTSTIYALLEASAQIVGASALALFVLAVTRSIEALPGGDSRTALGEDVANMLFGFMLTWAYLAFMQWVIIWAGDLPDDIRWYMLRSENGWQHLLLLLVLVHFVAPFAGFLIRDVKRSHRGLLWLAAALLAGHFADVAWRIRPPLADDAAVWPDLAAFAAVGGLWLGGFLFARAHPQTLFLLRRRAVDG